MTNSNEDLQKKLRAIQHEIKEARNNTADRANTKRLALKLVDMLLSDTATF